MLDLNYNNEEVFESLNLRKSGQVLEFLRAFYRLRVRKLVLTVRASSGWVGKASCA